MAYEYVKRAYGVDPQIGGRVRLEHTGKEGVIAARAAYDNYVWVTFNGVNFATPCHPKSLEYLPAASEEAVQAEACVACGLPFEPDHVRWLCDESEGSWHGPCFDTTPCGRGVHGEGCPTLMVGT